jgi:O-antigen ligase
MQTFWAVNPDYHMDGAILFTKYLALYVVIYQVASEEWGFDTFATAHILGCGILGWFALSYTAGGRIEGVGPANADDANAVAAQLLTGLIFCGFYFLLLRGQALRRMAIFIAVPFIVNTIILAASRGAVLALLATIPAAVYLAPKRNKLKIVAGALCGALLFVALANDVFWDRMDTMITGQYGSEAAPETRARLLEVGWKMAKDYPFGAGHRGFEALSSHYVDPLDLTADGVRAAHNTFIAVLVDQGFPGAILFIGLNIWCVVSLIRARRSPIPMPPSDAIKRAAVGASLMALFVAGQFSNLLKAEVQVWLLAMLGSLDAARAMQTFQLEPDLEQLPLSVAPHPFEGTTPMAGETFRRPQHTPASY